MAMNFVDKASNASLERTRRTDVLSQARLLFGEKRLRSLYAKPPLLVPLRDTTEIWETRLGNTNVTGKQIHGANELVANLKSLAPETTLEQFGFESDTKTGVMFFNHRDGAFIGAAIVARRPPA